MLILLEKSKKPARTYFLEFGQLDKQQLDQSQLGNALAVLIFEAGHVFHYVSHLLRERTVSISDDYTGHFVQTSR